METDSGALENRHIGSSSEAEVDVYVESKALSDTRTTLSEHCELHQCRFPHYCPRAEGCPY